MRSKFVSFLALLSLLTLGSCRSETSASDIKGSDISSENAGTSSSDSSSSFSSNEALSSNSSLSQESSSTASEDDKEYTISELVALCPEDGTATTKRFRVRATIQKIVNPNYGQMIIEDDTGELDVYGTYDKTGEKRYSEMTERPVAGDEVLLYGTLQSYNGNPEIKSGWILEFKHDEAAFDETAYSEKTIRQARDVDAGSLVKVTGTVAQVTYANGMAQNGFVIVDNESSIYVYDNSIVQVGNKVTVFAKKDYYILSNEQTNATKFGYKGANQLCDVKKLVNDNKTDNPITLDWASEKTIRDIMKTSVKEDVTNLVFKANALIKKSQGTGFVNYYIDDLDGKTGSYVYTQANGKDLSYLEKFDGKICEVYFVCQNAKSTGTGCTWRFLPIQVKDNNFVFDKAKAPKFALDYYAFENIMDSYTGDPSEEMVTTFESELLGISGVTISYTSDNTDSAYFETKDGKTYLHCKSTGSATLTATAHLDGQTDATLNKTIQVKDASSISSVNVKSAIDAAKDTSLTVKGVVGPSLVNKEGFYLIDETGAIAVVINDANTLSTIRQGQTIILNGKRDLYTSSTGSYGEVCLTQGEVIANLYGKTDYSTTSFIKDKTLADVKVLDVNDSSNTAKVYSLKASFQKVEEKNYSKAIIYTYKEDDADKNKPSISMELYCSNANQYSWLNPYYNPDMSQKPVEYDVEIAVCNWNSKNFFKACILSVTDSTGKKVLNDLNFR